MLSVTHSLSFRHYTISRIASADFYLASLKHIHIHISKLIYYSSPYLDRDNQYGLTALYLQSK